MRSMLVAVLVACLLVVGGPVSAQEDRFPFAVVEAWLDEDPSTVLVSAQYTCGPAEGVSGVVDITLRQGEVTGYGQASLDRCDGLPQTVEATVTSRDGRAFSPGALANVVTSGDVGGQSTDGEGEVWIRPIPPTLSFTVGDQAKVSSRTTAVVTGTYTCGSLDFSQGGGGVVDLTVQQGSVSGSGYVDTVVCDGTPQAWSATVTAYAGRFRRGAALGLASGYVCGHALPDVYTCQTTGQIEQSLTLRR